MSENPKKPKAELSNLNLNDGSLVDKGDNPPAQVAMWKALGGEKLMASIRAAWASMRAKKPASVTQFNPAAEAYVAAGDPGKPADVAQAGIPAPGASVPGGKSFGGYEEPEQPMTMGQILGLQQFEEQFCALRAAFVQSVYSILEHADAESMGAMMGETVGQFASKADALVSSITNMGKRAELQKIITGLRGAVTKSDGAGDAVAHALDALMKFELAVPEETTTKGDGAQPDVTTKKEQDMDKQPITLEAALKGITDPAVKAVIEAQLAKAAKPDSEQAELKKRLEATEKDAAESKARVAKLEEEQMDASLLAKAKALMVPGIEIAKVQHNLKKAYAIAKDVGEDLEQSYRALSKQAELVAKYLVNVNGHNGSGQDTPDTAHGQMEKAAAELMKADPKLTFAQAYTKAGQMNPALKQAAIENKAAV